MQAKTLDYQAAGSGGTPPRRKRAATILAWVSFAVGGLAVGCLPELMAARYSMAGFIFAPFVWLFFLVAFATAVVSVVLRRRGVVAWFGLFLGAFGLVWCTAFMLIPPARHDF